MTKLFVRKDIEQITREAADPLTAEGESQATLKRSLSAFHLVMLGVGAIIGAGIFSLTGTAAALYAGPGIIYSFVIGAVLCAFAGLCYAEMAAMVPVAGSAYSYAYATMGEFIAWIIGWDLILEYAFAAVTVATSWSGYFLSLVQKTLGIPLSDSMLRFTKGPWELVTLADGTQVAGLWNLPASFVALMLGAVLYRGLKHSTLVNNIVVVIKLVIIVGFIVLGWSVVDPSFWVGNDAATGLARLVPPASTAVRHGQEVATFGWAGVLTGAGVVFFAYIGFDAISTTAQECKNPARDMPIGILVSLFFCTTLYVLTALVMTGLVPYTELGVPDPIAVGVDRIVALSGWPSGLETMLALFVKLGALAGLTSVILVMLMGQSRIFYAMSKDGLLPWFKKLHPRFATPHTATVTTALFVASCAGFLPMSLVGELVSIGTLFAFVLVCTGIPILRLRYPNAHRPFKTPAYWFVAPAGALSCLWVMSGLPADTWLRFIVWLALGIVVYFAYGANHSRLRNPERNESEGTRPLAVSTSD